ncbi:MAG TPA: hypothetical protein VF839_01135 [Clostridium sp.]
MVKQTKFDNKEYCLKISGLELKEKIRSFFLENSKYKFRKDNLGNEKE